MNNVEDLHLDRDMSEIVLQIEKDQLDQIERNREEEELDDEDIILYQTQMLDIHDDLSLAQRLQLQSFSISKEDKELESIFEIPKNEPVILITLQDLVFSKKNQYARGIVRADQNILSLSDPSVIKMYKKAEYLLANFQSSESLPKVIKIIPFLPNWDEILLLTNPFTWTPQATYEITKVFLNNVKATQMKQFFQFVLLHIVRSNTIENNQLNPSLYLALRAAISRVPGLFLKGFVFPLCELKCYILKESIVIANIIAQAKFPVLYTATALLKLSDLPFTLSVCILIFALLKKEQALPYRVVDALVINYFCRRAYEATKDVLPNLWYESLQTFVKSYQFDMVPIHKYQLLVLVQQVKRNEISNIIEKELRQTMSAVEEKSINHYYACTSEETMDTA
ncbi:MAG: Bystin-domain-containing protein [Benjaminiella poitrasii]|nr:MAG: Bystin-domain-containing protein [Benjaminiella poitrasii]